VVSERRVSPPLAAELEQARETLDTRQAVIGQLDSGQMESGAGFSEIFAGFARLAWPGSRLWLTGFSVTRGGEAIEIRGRTLDASALPAYVQGLGKEAAFQGRRFSGLEMQDREVKADAASAPARFTEFVLRSENAPEGRAAGGRGS
jgi:hypothetical protein